MTRSSKRKHWDVPRIREAIAGPGIDPRTWATAARISEVQWDPALGWVVEAVAYGSALEGQTLTCRQSSSLAGPDAGEYLPLAMDAEVLISLPAADTEDQALVVSGLTNEEDKAPTEIHGLPIDGETESSSASKVSPYDTEIKVSPFNRREHYAKDYMLQAATLVLKADTATEGVKLGSENAAKSYVLGEELMIRLIAAIEGVVSILATGIAPNAVPLAPGPVNVDFSIGVAAWQLLWSTPVTGLKAQLQSSLVLSDKIKGE